MAQQDLNLENLEVRTWRQRAVSVEENRDGTEDVCLLIGMIHVEVELGDVGGEAEYQSLS